jgi:nitrous oxidase accessory protein NosD
MDMTLIDLIEMVVDWESAALRLVEDSHAIDVIDMQQKRFNLDDQLTVVIKNTLMDLYENWPFPR